jgi:glycosyltransferase involved in cell wall biosynthesis
MKVLTFGWDFPPSRNGGLGVACFGLTRELTHEGVEVIFVLPKRQDTVGNLKFVFADLSKNVKVKEVDSLLKPYHSASSELFYIESYDSNGNPVVKSRTIIEEVHRFAHQASLIARQENFDIIHAHDWTSFLAGVAAKKASGKPLVLHVHATSFDQAASTNVDPEIFKLECECFNEADKIVTVSQFTKNILIDRHGVDSQKIEVVHNGCDTHEPPKLEPTLAGLKSQNKKIGIRHVQSNMRQ